MKVLVYGSFGWIGNQFIDILDENNINYICGISRVDNINTLINEIEEHKPTHIISFIGRTHGKINEKIYPTIDYLEQKGKLHENIRDNLYSPLLLSIICQKKNIHLSYLGTGCIFTYDDKHPYETDENGQFISFTNESVWAKEFSEVMGVLDNNTLQKVQNFNFDGMIVKKELFLESGGLKTNMKLTFTYEFLLRMSYNDVTIMVIPKLGYKHTNNREGSLFVEYKNTIDVLESKFWVNKAKKEYFFTEDREITYEN